MTSQRFQWAGQLWKMVIYQRNNPPDTVYQCQEDYITYDIQRYPMCPWRIAASDAVADSSYRLHGILKNAVGMRQTDAPFIQSIS